MKLKSSYVLCILFIGTVLNHQIQADNNLYDFYQRIKDIATYQKELAAATVAFTYLAYTAPTMDSRRQLAAGALVSYILAKTFTPRRSVFEDIVTIAADESGYKQVNYSYPNKQLKEQKKNIMIQILDNFAKQTDNIELKNKIQAFIDTIDELTSACKMQKNNSHLTEKELRQQISKGFHELDELIAHPSNIEKNVTFQIKLTTIETTLKELIVLAAHDTHYHQRREDDPQADHIFQIQDYLIKDMKNKAIKDFQIRDVLIFETMLNKLLKQMYISAQITNDNSDLKQAWANTLDEFVNNPKIIKDYSLFHEIASTLPR